MGRVSITGRVANKENKSISRAKVFLEFQGILVYKLRCLDFCRLGLYGYFL